MSLASAAEGSMGALLEAPLPAVTADEVAAIARAFFGLNAVATPLTGERDRNFHLRAEDGAEYALRVINVEEKLQVSDFQSRALEHLARHAPEVPAPRLHRPLTGEACEAVWQSSQGRSHRVRVLDYLPGRPAHILPLDNRQRRAVGTCLARLDLGLRDFRHGAEDHRLLWDVQHAAGLRHLTAFVPDARDARLVYAVLDRFEDYVLPAAPGLRRQVIHNDFNCHNILVDLAQDDVITGIIDFGDMVRAPLIQDLATAAAYQVAEAEPPLEGPAALAAAFHATYKLEAEEVAILPDLLATRLATTVLISGLRAKRQPDNADYILRNYPGSISAMRRLAEISRTEAHALLLERLGV